MQMNIYIYSTISLTIGFLLDLLIGDPHSIWHPVQGIGWLIEHLEKILRCVFPGTESGERRAGVFLVILTLAGTLAISAVPLFVAYRISVPLGIALESIYCGRLLATKSLKDESAKVAEALDTDGLEAGRKAVSMIVGRDTENLTEEGVIKAAVETVAENTSDGVVAPLFFMALAGGLGGFFYKAVNTMDSMVGYKNDRYLHFGRAAAKLDDVCNFLPARLSARLMIAAAFLLGMNGANARKIYLRDRYNHDSPNSAHTEAVMAGALGVRLAGDAWYFGKLHKKKTIGDALRPIERADIGRSHRLLYETAVLAAISMLGVKLLIVVLLSFA